MNRNLTSYASRFTFHVSRFTSYVSRLEPLLLLLLAPFFVFPRPELTPWLMALIALLWLIRWLAHGRLTVRTPLDVPLLMIVAMMTVNAWATFSLRRSFPKLCGVFFGIALFYALVNGVRRESALRWGVVLLLGGGVATAGLSLIGTRWSSEKIPFFSSLMDFAYERIPLLLQGVPRAEGGFNANQIGGAVALFIPLAAALLLYQFYQWRRVRLGARWLVRTAALTMGLALLIFVLLLTQSRMAYLATALALLLLMATQGRWPRIAVLIILVVGVGAMAYVGPYRAAQALFGSRNLEVVTGDISLTGRMEIWRRALRVIKDHPLTGIGFDTLFPVIHARYPTFFIPSGHDGTHAHNFFLQTALDLGLPGFLAFMWLLVAFGRMMWRVRTDADIAGHRALATGLFFGILAQLFFGLGDAIALGQKPGFFLWAYLGLGAALWTEERGRGGAEEQRSRGAGERRSRGDKEQGSRGAEERGRGGDKERGSRGARGTFYVSRMTHDALRFTHYVSRFTSYVSHRPVLVVGLLVILVAVGWSYGRVARARAWASLLQADVQMMEALAQGESQGRVLQEAQGMLHQTRADLRGARAEFALPLALAPHLGWVPGYGADLQVLPILLEMGLQLTEAGEVALGALQPALAVGTDGTGVDEAAPEAVIAGLERARPQVVQAIATLEEVRRMRQAIPKGQLSPRLAALVDRLDRALPLVENGLRGAMMLPDVLGASGARTYLILVQNEDELRATGGFISGVARITVDQGRIVRLDFEDSYAVDDFTKAYPLAPRPLREIWGPVPWVFRDSNWSPDFPTAAQVAIALYRLRYENADVDGVIALDQQAIQLLVAALEPLDVAAYPEPVTGDDVIQAAREAWEPSEEEGLSEAWWRQRKNFMGRVLVTAVRKLQNEPDQVNLAPVGQAVLQALEERHLFVYLPEEEAASSLRETGWNGAIRDAPGDYLMVVDANLGFNKVNPLISERLTYTVDLRQPERPRATLALTYRHTGSPTDEPCQHGSRYDLTYEQMMQRCYWDYVRVYAPQGSRLLNASTQPVPGELLLTGNEGLGEVDVLSQEAGKSVFATLFVLERGGRTRADYSYNLPVDVVDHAEGAWHYRLYLQKQGGTDANDVQVNLILAPSARQVVPSHRPTRWEGDSLVYETQLRTDLSFSVRWRE